jgi:hypothetical protein
MNVHEKWRTSALGEETPAACNLCRLITDDVSGFEPFHMQLAQVQACKGTSAIFASCQLSELIERSLYLAGVPAWSNLEDSCYQGSYMRSRQAGTCNSSILPTLPGRTDFIPICDEFNKLPQSAFECYSFQFFRT